MSLSRIEVITGMSKFSSLKAALSKAGVRGMTVMQVLGCGVEKGTREYEVDELEEMELLPKQQINIVVETERVNSIVEIIKEQLYTGHIGARLASGVSASARQAARAALNGSDPTGGAKYFKLASSGHAGTVVGPIVFY